MSQQYVRNAFRDELGYDRRTGFDRTIARKLKEALLAIKLERKISKNQILERYLNTIYFGRSAYGAEAAARTYFGTKAENLTLLQSATLVGLIPRPVGTDPFEYPERALQERNRVLRRMAEAGFISDSTSRELQEKPLKVHNDKQTRRERNVTRGPAAYFVDYAKRTLQQKYGESQTFTGGLRVTTTIDMKMQRFAEKAVSTHLGDRGDPDAALVAIDNRTGEVRAMIGGKNFRKAKCNLATARGGGRNCGTGRQTGSSFKMFTLAAAVDKGISLRSVFSGPGRIVMKDNPECGEWSTRGVGNYADSGSGTMDLIGATAKSVNTIYAQLVAEVGPQRVVEMAKRLGIKSKLSAVCSITLGVHPVSPLEMTTSFATIASGGVRRDPTPLRRVETSEGEVLYRNTKDGKRVMKENDAWQVAKALRSVVTGGTGTAAALPNVEIIGKTGTSQNHANAYFCGSSRILTTCVWVGHSEGNIPMSGVTGGSYPARIFHSFMAPAHEGKSVPGFPEPTLTGKTVKGKNVSTGDSTAAPEPTQRKPKPKPKQTVQPSPKPEPEPEPEPTCGAPPNPPCPEPTTGTGSSGSGTSSTSDPGG